MSSPYEIRMLANAMRNQGPRPEAKSKAYETGMMHHYMRKMGLNPEEALDSYKDGVATVGNGLSRLGDGISDISDKLEAYRRTFLIPGSVLQGKDTLMDDDFTRRKHSGRGLMASYPGRQKNSKDPEDGFDFLREARGAGSARAV